MSADLPTNEPSTAIDAVPTAHSRLARHPLVRVGAHPFQRWAVTTCTLLGLAIAALFGWVRVPVPTLHDEFSYLLAADTFADGRLTNPTPTGWQHLESFHILQQPSYQSKYPPGHALFLALGMVLAHHPMAGVWMELCLAIGATVWCLQGFLPRKWALWMGLIVSLHPLIHWEWGQSYRMGSLPMAAGALLFGSVARVRTTRRLSWQVGIVTGLGVVLLALTRPFEGLLACCCCGAYLAAHIWAYPQRLPELTWRLVLPALCVIGFGGAFLLRYNQAVTGSAWRMPYQAYQQQYGYSPLFVWQDLPATPTYTHPVMHSLYHGWELEWYRKHADWRGLLEVKAYGLRWMWLFYLGIPCTIPLLMLGQVVRQPRYQFLLGSVAVGCTGIQFVPWFFPHYLAPFAAPLFVVVGAAMRQLWYFRFPHGRRFVMSCLALQVVGLGAAWMHAAREPRDDWQWQRHRIAQELEQLPGIHVVIVRYDAGHVPHGEWVYNRADIGQAKVVWARDTPALDLQRVQELFPGRSVWTIYPDQPFIPRMAGVPLLPAAPSEETRPGETRPGETRPASIRPSTQKDGAWTE